MEEKDITDVMVCEAYQNYERGLEWPHHYLKRESGQKLNKCLRACQQAHGKGLIQYDRSLRHGWLTDRGRCLVGLKKVEPKPVHAYLAREVPSKPLRDIPRTFRFDDFGPATIKRLK